MSSQAVIVYTANGRLPAEVVRGLLEAAGLHAWLSQESVGGIYGLIAGPLGEVNVLVTEADAEAARVLIAEMESGQLET